ncbi:MAG: DUF6378 domain-containing protein, partial [Clostridiales bacterium]|nr:DUF6378 domain-containing protein [Clostridiales bacterium]
RAARGRPYREAETPAENPQHETKPKPSEAGSALRGGAAERTSVRLTAGRERYEASADEVGRAECLSRARECVCGERETDYGTPEDSFTAIARLWSAYLSNACRCEIELSPIDVACMMGLLKIARIGGGRATVDSWVDLAGYAACGCEITTRRQEAGA